MSKSNPILAVNEIFGPTFQGEGPNAGKPCVFLRLAGCNLACTWCDTRYAWDWTKFDSRAEIHPMIPLDVYNKLRSIKGNQKRLIITGGEPMLQQGVLLNLVDMLHDQWWFVEIETAGTIPIRYIGSSNNSVADQFNVSIKLSNSGNSFKKRIRPEAINSFVDDHRAIFKFVMTDDSGWREIDDLISRYAIHPSRVYIMPEGIDSLTLNNRLPFIAKGAVERGFNISNRLQVTIYGNQRGI